MALGTRICLSQAYLSRWLDFWKHPTPKSWEELYQQDAYNKLRQLPDYCCQPIWRYLQAATGTTRKPGSPLLSHRVGSWRTSVAGWRQAQFHRLTSAYSEWFLQRPKKGKRLLCKSWAAVNNKRALSWIISLDFRPKAWYVVLLEGGECFGATEEAYQSKLHWSGCFPLREAAAFASSAINSYCTEPWLP